MSIGKFELNEIYTGDMLELSKSIPDNSIDLIFTDPPYPYEFIQTYSWLSEVAARVLKNNSLCFAYAGNTVQVSIGFEATSEEFLSYDKGIDSATGKATWGAILGPYRFRKVRS